jgi:tRNA-binding EMAP/Myf-like protein
MLVVVCCGIPKVGAKSSMVVRLWKWFINWADVLCIVASPTDAQLVCGLVCAKLTTQEEEEEEEEEEEGEEEGGGGLMLVASSFLLSHSSINLCNNSQVLFACLTNVELIID